MTRLFSFVIFVRGLFSNETALLSSLLRNRQRQLPLDMRDGGTHAERTQSQAALGVYELRLQTVYG